LTIQSACRNSSHIESGAAADGMASPSGYPVLPASQFRVHDRSEGPSQRQDRHAKRHRLRR
jgi:hypothetical protein